MKIDIQTKGFSLTAALSAHVRRRLQSALEIRDRHIIGARVRLSDINGPRGGIDKRCQFSIEVAGAPSIVVRDTSENMYTAIDRATRRLARSVGRRTERLRRGKGSAKARDEILLNNQSLAV